MEWTMEAGRKRRRGGGCLCKVGQQACLFIFFPDPISLSLLFCGLVQVIEFCGSFGVISLPTGTVPGELSEVYPLCTQTCGHAANYYHSVHSAYLP